LANGIQYIPSVTLSNIADILCVCVCVTDEMRAVMCDRKRAEMEGHRIKSVIFKGTVPAFSLMMSLDCHE